MAITTQLTGAVDNLTGRESLPVPARGGRQQDLALRASPDPDVSHHIEDFEVVVRACQPDDGDELTTMYEHLSTKSVYQRFFGLSRTVMATDVRRLTRDKLDRHVALVALVDGHIVGVASMEPLDGDHRSGEISLLVDDAFQHEGVGGALLQRLEAAASDEGFTLLVADTLGTNVSMLRLLRHAGFSLARSPLCGVIQAKLGLSPASPRGRGPNGRRARRNVTKGPAG
jgi:GNAT superfamily N-acetyltransferase